MLNAVSWWSQEKPLADTSFPGGGGPALSEPVYQTISGGAFLASTSALQWRMLEINVTAKTSVRPYCIYKKVVLQRAAL